MYSDINMLQQKGYLNRDNLLFNFRLRDHDVPTLFAYVCF